MRLNQVTNDHGIQGEMIRSGGILSGLVFVPDCCLSCLHLDIGEFDEFGYRVAPPECKVSLRFPTKKGTCKRQKVT